MLMPNATGLVARHVRSRAGAEIFLQRSWLGAMHAAMHAKRHNSSDGLPARGPAYLDMQATTPLDPRALDAMMPYLQSEYGNPHSKSHVYGWTAEEATENSRKQIASLIGADSKEIFFTSGATESNNLAIKGIANFYGSKKKHMITTQIEHKCVLASCRRLQVDDGWDITYLGVNKDGLLDVKELEAAIRPDTALVSVMYVNNEIGVVQPIKEIGAICRKNKVFFHVDAAQAVGKIPVSVNDDNIDLLSISAHKLYGPKGIGALYIRRKPRVRVKAVIDGGGQERGMRSGTLPTPIIVGFGAAAEVCQKEMENDTKHVERLYQRMYRRINEGLPKVIINGSEKYRYRGNLNISFACVEGESLLMSLASSTAVSSGSACTSASLEPSYVLRAIGVNEELAHTSLRFGFGRFTTEEEVDRSVDHIITEVTRLREMSPLWELELEAEETGERVNVTWS